jgi:decaprenylphospho-beta-D-ribofuranose 2-oxidase
MKIAGWGNYPRGETLLLTARDPADLRHLVIAAPTVIARGAGRAYGDAAIGIGSTLSLSRLDRMVTFEPETGRLTVEGGVRLADVIDVFLPRGLFPPVVPGTKFVTFGGMVAANVHGKNHHLSGGFGRHVERLTLLLADGKEVVCGTDVNRDLFRATIGGMGLTGVIRDVTFRLMPVESAFVRQETIAAPDLDAVMLAFEDSRNWTYTVAWIDCLAHGTSLGRSLLYRGEHARLTELDAARSSAPYQTPDTRLFAVPFDLPSFTLNRVSVGLFNKLYFRNGLRKQGSGIIAYEPYFFPLDAISDWNRIYGRRGFVQYQCVIPKHRSRDGLGEILELVSRHGSPSFLAVLKLLGPDDAGLMSFPLEGYTLALDFPAMHATFALLSQIDRVLLGCGGRIYLAKDACQNREMIEAGYPNLNAFRDLRRLWGADARFHSLQSERLGL